MNQTLDIQWQPRNDLAIDIGYVGNLGRHEVIPVPFNQAQIASPTNPIRQGHALSSRTTPTVTPCRVLLAAAPLALPITLPDGTTRC